MQTNLYISTFMVGYLAASTPSKKSNIHPLLASALIGLLYAKLVFGDWDKGFQFTVSDILFGIIIILCALLGGILSIYIKKKP